jgi:DNA-binding transcriptional regulator LsrR (DeoR family)
MFAALPLVRRVHVLAAKADAALVGVGQMDLNGPQRTDSFHGRKLSSS